MRNTSNSNTNNNNKKERERERERETENIVFFDVILIIERAVLLVLFSVFVAL